MKKYLWILIALVCLFLPVQAQQLSEDEVSEHMNRAYALVKEKKNAEALEHFLLVGEQTQAQRDSLECQVYVLSQISAAKCYDALQQYDEAYQLADRLMQCGRLNGTEKEKLTSIYVYDGYIAAMQSMDLEVRKFDKARGIFNKILPYADAEMKQRIKGRYAFSWYAEACVHHIHMDFPAAIEAFERASGAFAAAGNRLYEANMLRKKADVEVLIYQRVQALTDFNRALDILRTVKDDESLLKTLISLWELRQDMGSVREQNAIMQEMESLNAGTDNAQAKLAFCTFRGKLAMKWNQYQLSELYFRKVEEIVSMLTPEEVGAYSNINHANLRTLYWKTGAYEKALKENELARQGYMSISSHTADKSHLFNLQAAELYACMGDRTRCMAQVDTMMTKERQMSDVVDKSYCYQFRGQCYVKFGEYGRALDDFKEADRLLATKYGEEHAERVDVLGLWAGAEYQAGHYTESENIYKKYAALKLKRFGANSMEYAEALLHQADIEGFAGHTDAGCRDYTAAVEILKSIARERLPFISSMERESLWNQISPDLVRLTAYALEAREYQTAFTASCYDALVLNKSFLLDTERSIYDVLKEGREESALHDFALLSTLKAKVRGWEKDYQLYSDSIMTLAPEIARLDQQLTEKSRAYGDIASFMDINYRKVRESLGKHEVLIDFTDFISKTQGRRYAAYVINARQQYPLLKNLFSEHQIDSLGITRPDMYYDPDYAADVLRLLWEPFRSCVREGDTVYYVPSQLLFNVSLESLPLEDGSLLGEHYRFVRLSSARELVKHEKTGILTVQDHSAVLYGGLQYDLDVQTMVQNARQYDLSRLLVMRGNVAFGDSVFSALPGSKLEVEQIGTILREHDYQVETLTDMQGSEESFLNLHGQSPQILHLATHGFYYTPERAERVKFLQGSTDAMSLSGLVMAGGNAAWSGRTVTDEALSGILTAHQIARLDLRGTELVVLSACQSGQGAATSEGLYGLQRAFKKAGVGTILMTLWSISDQKATEFMVQYYDCLAERKNRWNKRKAFAEATRLFRQKYPDPYYWAAFVMLD